MAKEFDLEAFAASSGARITGQNEDGTVNMSVVGPDGTDVNKVFDAPAFLKSKGVNPTDVSLKVNSPDTAFDENALGFGSAIKFAMGRTPQDKMATLIAEYGADNVAQSSDGQFKVKDKGAWKVADPSFLQNIGAVAPEMAAGMAGTAAGAQIGALIGAPLGAAAGSTLFGVGALPGIAAGVKVGSIVGGLAGGALSAAVAKWGKDEVAEKLNLRTEADGVAALDEVKKEFVHNMIWDTALFGAGKALAPVAKAGGKIIKRAADNFFDKETMAATASKLFPGTLAADWGTVLRSGKDADVVMKDMGRVIDYNKKAVAGTIDDVIDPAAREMNVMAVGAVNEWRDLASKTYNKNMDVLERAGAFNNKIQAAPLLSKFGEALDDLGLRRVNSSGKLEFVPTNQFADDSPAKALMDPRALGVLRKVYGQLERAAGWEGKAAGQRVFDPHLQKMVFRSKPQGMLNFKEAKQLLDGIDDVLESSGYYKGGDMAIGSNARRMLKETRAGIRKALGESVPEGARVTVEGGKSVSQRELYNSTLQGWHNFRNNYDDFALPSKFGGGDTSAIQATVNRMLGKNGAGLEETFGQLAASVGQEAAPTLVRLKQLRASKNLAAVYAGNSGWGAVAARPVLGGPRDHAARMAWASQKFDAGATVKQMPISRATVSTMQSLAKGASWLNDIGYENKMKLFTSPDMFRQFVGTVFQAPQAEEQQTQQLIRGAQGGQ